MLSKLLAATLCITALSSCAGYQLGTNKPSELKSVHSIHVPLFENKTQEQRLATLVTNSVVDSITRDGTYAIATTATSDAELVASIKRIKYSKRRSSRFDSLLASELYLDMTVEWSIVDAQNRVLTQGSTTGRSQFSNSEKQQLARTNAMSDAAKDAAKQITLRLANGF